MFGLNPIPKTIRTFTFLLFAVATVNWSFAGKSTKLQLNVLGTSTTAPKGYVYSGDSIVAPTEPFMLIAQPLTGVLTTSYFSSAGSGLKDRLY
jgi:hypothetical protein